MGSRKSSKRTKISLVPRVKAKDNQGEVMAGKNGTMWISQQDKKGRKLWRWVRFNKKYKNISAKKKALFRKKSRTRRRSKSRTRRRSKSRTRRRSKSRTRRRRTRRRSKKSKFSSFGSGSPGSLLQMEGPFPSYSFGSRKKK
jgi:exosome complex RNA-binding protein Rrp4